jgi:hypothetical protein
MRREAPAPGEHQLALRLGRLETAVVGQLAGAERGERRQLRNEGNSDPRNDHLAHRLQSGRLHIVAAVVETAASQIDRDWSRRQCPSSSRTIGSEVSARGAIRLEPMIARHNHEDRLTEQRLPAQIVAVERQGEDHGIERSRAQSIEERRRLLLAQQQPQLRPALTEDRQQPRHRYGPAVRITQRWRAP